ncbi:hypothetical protein E8E14_013559 [Neopestalotiopsis sp. 37M]|nr:hypothetical protein E8E14_013559 [Neopestalotiopsis sp. 37M]
MPTSSPNTAGVYAAAVVLIVASTAACGLRFVARKVKSVPLLADDWLVLCATLLTWGLGIILIYGASYGTLGTHTDQDPTTGAVIVTHHEIDISKYNAISSLLSVIALGLLKIGVVMFYRRIFVSDWFKKISMAIIVVISLWTVAFFFATVLECKAHNLDLIWKSIVTFKQECGMYKDVQWSHAISDVITDLIVLSLPLPEIWKLNMTVRLKLVVSAIFLVGLLSTAAGTARLAIVSTNVVQTTAGSRDVRGVGTNTMVWTYVEVGVGVVAACLPTLKPIFRGRTLDSIVASVRSVLSIPSNRSRGSNASSRRQRADGTQDLEMYPYGTPKQSHNYSQISGPGSVPGSRAGSTKTDMPALPANAVHRRDDVTVHSSRAVNATSSASEEATERTV